MSVRKGGNLEVLGCAAVSGLFVWLFYRSRNLLEDFSLRI